MMAALIAGERDPTTLADLALSRMRTAPTPWREDEAQSRTISWLGHEVNESGHAALILGVTSTLRYRDIDNQLRRCSTSTSRTSTVRCSGSARTRSRKRRSGPEAGQKRATVVGRDFYLPRISNLALRRMAGLSNTNTRAARTHTGTHEASQDRLLRPANAVPWRACTY
jgi:hypothetical protein